MGGGKRRGGRDEIICRKEKPTTNDDTCFARTVVDNVVLHVLRQAFSAINALLQLCVSNVTGHNDSATQREARAEGEAERGRV